jgi:hypothetical protein|tara:strand:- start:1270 stop:1371 length:102 start_codon:yes stop_codon:yes gene_type:complete
LVSAIDLGRRGLAVWLDEGEMVALAADVLTINT